MSSPGIGINPLAIYDPQTYAAQLAIQRRQALAQSLMQQGESNAGAGQYGGLRNAGNTILGAFLAKRADKQLGDLYNPPANTDPGQAPSGPTVPPAASMGAALAGNAPAQPAVQQPSQAAPQPSNDKPPDYASLPPQAQRIYDQIPHIPGMPARQALNYFLTNPTGYQAAWAKQFQPTPEQQNAAFVNPNDPQAQRSAVGAIQTKAGTIDLRDMGGAIIPDGRGGYTRAYGPNEASNVYYSTGPNGEPIAHPIQGGAAAAANTAGLVEGAKERNKIIEVKLPDGRTIPMRAGDVVPYGGAQSQPDSSLPPNIDRNNPLNVSPGGQVTPYKTPTAGLGAAWDNLGSYQKQGINTVAGVMNKWAPVTDGNGRVINPNTPQNIAMISQKLGVRPDQTIDLSDPNVKGQLIDLMRPTETGNRYAGNNSPPQIGETTAQRGVNEAAGTAAVGNAHAQAVTQSTLKAIDGLIALNDQTPDSTGISPDWKSDINKRAPVLFKGDAGALAQWNQLNGIGVLGGLKQLQGLGRLDLPEVNQVVKTNGVPADVPRAERLKILQNLKTMVQNNLAASQNNVANLNAPGITTSTAKAPMGNFGQPHPQDIVDELRRRGVVK